MTLLVKLSISVALEYSIYLLVWIHRNMEIPTSMVLTQEMHAMEELLLCSIVSIG